MLPIGKDVKLIEYKKSVDTWNCLTHAAGAAFGVAALIISIIKTAHSGTRVFLSAVIYCLALTAVYLVSALYHGLPAGEKKRCARLLDHSAVPLLIAGTATPCSLITLYAVSRPHSIAVFVLGWFCALFGVFSKVFFFEKLKAAAMTVYIAGSAVMLACVIPLLGGGRVNAVAYGELLVGCLFYIVGALFCRWGIKKEEMHIVFHLLVLVGSIIQFCVIYKYVL